MAEEMNVLSRESEGFFKDRGSKFYAYAYPVTSLGEVEEKLSQLKKKYYDARHHCYAYRLGKNGEKTYASDDGEPSHSAGTPILSALRSFSLTDAAIIVVRYFGGTKLGVRGLIEAYRQAAEDAIQNNELIAVIPKITFSIQFAYDQTSEINRLFHPFDLENISSDYTEICRQTLAIREEDFPALEQVLNDSGFSVKIDEG